MDHSSKAKPRNADGITRGVRTFVHLLILYRLPPLAMSGAEAGRSQAVVSAPANGTQLTADRKADASSNAQQEVVGYAPGTVGHLVQSEDLPAPPPSVARNKVG